MLARRYKKMDVKKMDAKKMDVKNLIGAVDVLVLV
jgi:hypothetical protein